jgi:hypothetical protein
MSYLINGFDLTEHPVLFFEFDLSSCPALRNYYLGTSSAKLDSIR